MSNIRGLKNTERESTFACVILAIRRASERITEERGEVRRTGSLGARGVCRYTRIRPRTTNVRSKAITNTTSSPAGFIPRRENGTDPNARASSHHLPKTVRLHTAQAYRLSSTDYAARDTSSKYRAHTDENYARPRDKVTPYDTESLQIPMIA